jgi:tRNA G18 (ribose-2'-O)-methylase SpoU
LVLTTPLIDPDDPRAAPYRRLRDKDAAVRRCGYVAEGVTVLEKAVGAGLYPLRSVLVSQARHGRLEPLLARLPQDVAVLVAPQAVMDAICGFPVHRGVLAYGPQPQPPTPEALLDDAPAQAVVVCAVGVNDADNMGAIFRNAAAFGAYAVLLDDRACDPFYRRAIRVSVGAALTMPSARLKPEQDMLAVLEERGFETVALSPCGAIPLKTLAPSPRTALLLGAEGPGLPADLLARALSVRIPMAAGFDSLNVAAASAVALHHLLG